tara:strand:+ start:3677 stop:3883 length:207 start_codon:yes stop_codon:yes gene_type:complete
LEGTESFKFWPLVLDIGTLAALIVIPVALAACVVQEFWAKARRVFCRVPRLRSPSAIQLYDPHAERDS